MTESKNSQKLKIHPEPFKSSYLAIPPSPFSPRTPLTLSSFPSQNHTKTYPIPDTSALPPSPLPWLWQCHQCRRTYPLGVTRRCLDDGHQFCAGTTTVKTWRKPLRPGRVKRHRACASEFDYQGWKTWGRWRRSGKRDSIYDESSSPSEGSTSEELGIDGESTRSSAQTNGAAKDCWNACDYPSECRWGKRFGVHTPVVTEFPVIETHPTPPPPPPPPSTTFEGILKPENCKEVKKQKKTEKTDFWGALVASATRRKSVPPSSPLATVTEEADAPELPKDKDGDSIMMNIDPSLLSQQSSDSPSAPASSSSSLMPVVTLKDIIRKSTKLVSKSSSRPAEVKEESKDDPKPIVSSSEAALGEFDFELEDRDKLTAELAPLTMVRSRDSGYHSTPDVC